MAIGIERFARALREHGVDAFTGVPCSAFRAFVSHAAVSDALPYTPAASEGEAVGIAAGAWLGGRLGAVLLQNSGLGNCVNPLTSLCATYEIPLLLLVSQRGEGGDDAPQHGLMGAVTRELLSLLRVPAHTLPDDDEGAARVLGEAADLARATSRPVALVIPMGSFEPGSDAPTLAPKASPRCQPERLAGDATRGSRAQALAAVASRAGALRDDDLVVSTTGMTSRELFALGDRAGSFYMQGSMGCAPAIGLGLAMSSPERRVIVLDGDGALLMKLGTLATIGHQAPGNLVHVLLDNGSYESTGGQPTTSANVAFEQLAAGAGYARALVAPSADALARTLAAFEPGQGPLFVTLAIESGHTPGVGRVGRTPQQIRDAFRHAVSDALRVP